MISKRIGEKMGCRWFTVDRTLLPLKAFYFFVLGAIGVLFPFIPLYMKQVGLTSVQTGVVYGFMPYVSFLVRPCVGFLADRVKRHKMILAVCSVMSGVFYMLLLVIPRVQSTRHTYVKSEIHCYPNGSYIRDCFNTTDDQTCPMSFTSYMDLMSKRGNFRDMSFLTNVTNVSFPVVDEMLLTSCSVSCQRKDNQSHRVANVVCFSKIQGVESLNCSNVFGLNMTHHKYHIELYDQSQDTRDPFNDIQADNNVKCQNFSFRSVVYEKDYYSYILCDEKLEMECSMQCSPSEKKVCQNTKTFGAESTLSFFVVFYLFGNIFSSPIVSIGDAMTYKILGNRRRLYGRQRLWGTIGFALFAMSSTFIMDIISKDSLSIDFSVSFYIFGGMLLITALCSHTLPISGNLTCSNELRNPCKLINNVPVVILLLVVAYFGFLTGAGEAFLFWFLSELDGFRPIIPGICTIVGCGSETLVFIFAGRIIGRIGHIPCLYITFAGYALRFFGYSLLTNAWYVLPFELLHSVTFALMWASATSYGSILVPPSLFATMQGLLAGIHFGIAKGTGSIITGLMYEPLGFVNTFRLYSALSLCLLIVFLMSNRLCLKLPGVSNEKLNTEALDEFTPEKEEHTSTYLPEKEEHTSTYLPKSNPDTDTELLELSPCNTKVL